MLHYYYYQILDTDRTTEVPIEKETVQRYDMINYPNNV